MKKEEIITLLIIILIVIGNIVSQEYTKKSMDEIDEKLANIKEEALSKQYDSKELADKMNKIYEDWKKREEVLSYYIEHAELEKVNTQILRSEALFEADIQDQCVSEIENGMYVLEHIKNKQAFSLKNIF